jgi:hypothetical protein
VLREVRAMDAQEIKIEEALEMYYRAAKEFNSLFPGLVPYEVVRDLFVSILLVLNGYRSKDNWNDGRPIITIPSEMALDLAENIDSVLGGHIPRWMLHMQKRGAPKRWRRHRASDPGHGRVSYGRRPLRRPPAASKRRLQVELGCDVRGFLFAFHIRSPRPTSG